MKHAGDGGRRWKIPSEKEVDVIEALLTLPKIVAKSELLTRFTFTWGRKKKRSVLVPKSESSPAIHRKVDDRRPEKVAAVDADKSPSTPLCFLPSGSGSGSGSDDADRPKRKSYMKKRTAEDLMEKFNQTAQEHQILKRDIKTMENLLQELRAENFELKARKHEIKYSRNRDDFQLWSNSMNINLDRHHYHQQITMFAPPPPPAPAHRQQFMVDPYNGKLVSLACSGSGNAGGRLGLFNQIDPRVRQSHGEGFDFMASSQPLDQNNYVVMDNDLRVRNAAAARQRRIMRMKESKNSRGACR